jgi:hypothetical protein
METFNLKQLKEVEGKQKYRAEVSNRFAALEDLDDEVELIVPGKYLERIQTFQPKRLLSYFEMKTHKPWFSKECSKLVDQRKQAKLQWLLDQVK